MFYDLSKDHLIFVVPHIVVSFVKKMLNIIFYCKKYIILSCLNHYSSPQRVCVCVHMLNTFLFFLAFVAENFFVYKNEGYLLEIF